MTIKASDHPDLTNLVLLVLGSMVLLPVCNGDMLYMAQERSLFMSGSIFLHDCLRNVGGGTEWVGRFLTQLFYYPWLGASVQVAIWAVTYWLLCRIFPLPCKWRWLLLLPVVSLLISTIDLGYWIYYIKLPGYWFRESVGLLCCTLLVGMGMDQSHRVALNGTDKAGGWWQKVTGDLAGRWWQKMAGVLAAVLSLGLYPLIGWYSVLALLIIAIEGLLAKRWIQLGVTFLLLLVGPPAIARTYTTLPAGEAWFAAFPAIESNFVFSWIRTLPFIIMAVTMVVLPVIRHYCDKKDCRPSQGKGIHYILFNRMLPALGLAGMFGWAYCANFSDHNFHAEIRAYHAIEEQRWADVLREVYEAPDGPTRQLVVSKNIALLHADHLHDLLFAFPCAGADPVPTDTLPVHLVQTAASLFYLYHGMTNDAIHWCIENSVEYGLTVSDLRILSLASLIGEEYDVAAKYLNMLLGTTFHYKFAQRYLPLALHPEWISEYPELAIIKELHDDFGERINNDTGNCEKMIYEAFANQAYHSKKRGLEAAMAYSLMLKDYELIWHHFPRYAHQLGKNKMPKQYQEAIYLGTQMTNAPHKAEEFRFDADIPQRFQFFFSNKNNPKDDHSFWWFYQYCTNVRFY